MPKPADRMTQRQLEDLRRELLPACARVWNMRCQIDRLDSTITMLTEWQAKTDDERDQHYYWTREENNRRLASGEIETSRAQIKELAPQIRDLADALTARAEPAWRHIAVHDDASWAKVAEVRPKVLRAEGSAVLCRLAAIISKPDRVPIGKWVVDRLQTMKKEGSLYGAWYEKPMEGLNATALSAISTYLSENNTQAGVQLDRIGLSRLAEQARAWRKTEQVRAQLANAGTPIGQVEAGELRLMDADELGNLGEYLHCCIDHAGYPQHARAKTKAFVTVYDNDLPVVAIEITPTTNQELILGQTQGMMNRSWAYRDQIEQWLARPETRGELASALGVEPDAETVTVTVPRQCGNYTAWQTGVSLWSTATVEWDLSQAVIGILSGETPEGYAVHHATNYLGDEHVAKLKDLISRARRNADNDALREYAQKQAAVEEKQAEFERVSEQYNALYSELDALQRQVRQGPPPVSADEAERLVAAL